MLIKQTTCRLFLTGAWQALLDTLFPIRCLGCRARNAWICDPCLSRLPVRQEQHCPNCIKHITPNGEVCFACRDEGHTALSGVFVASYYHDTLLPCAIHNYKYRFLSALANPLARFLQSALEKTSLPLPDIIIPVPLHRKRLKFRGFNQSELLARELASLLTPGIDLPLESDVLLRIRATTPQIKTGSREERLHNLRDAFAIHENKVHHVAGKSVWLIDDVATTGTTLSECANTLKKNGARSVFGIVLAR